MLMFPETGFNLVHVDDVADGIVLAHDKGEVGESYVLGGQIAKMRDADREGGRDLGPQGAHARAAGRGR